MKKILFSYLALILTLSSCGLKADNCSKESCGHSVTIKKEIYMHTLFQGTVTSEGAARYLWYTEEGFACTVTDALVIFKMNLNEQNKIVPTDVKLWVITGGNLDELTLEPRQSASATSFNDILTFRLFDATNLCHASVQLRLQIDFESFGTSALNDAYMEELLEGEPAMQITFAQGLD